MTAWRPRSMVIIKCRVFFNMFCRAFAADASSQRSVLSTVTKHASLGCDFK